MITHKTQIKIEPNSNMYILYIGIMVQTTHNSSTPVKTSKNWFGQNIRPGSNNKTSPYFGQNQFLIAHYQEKNCVVRCNNQINSIDKYRDKLIYYAYHRINKIMKQVRINIFCKKPSQIYKNKKLQYPFVFLRRDVPLIYHY